MKLREKLLLAFIIVVMVSASLVALVAGAATRSYFNRYVEGYRAQRVGQWKEILYTYYQSQGSWEGIQYLVAAAGRRRSPGAPGPNINERIILTTPEGIVIADSNRGELGVRLPEDLLRQGFPLEIGGQTIGILHYHFPPITGLATLERTFYGSVIKSILTGSLLATLVAIALALFFTRRITTPLLSLNQAAERLAAGNLNQRVNLTLEDEIGELGKTFNAMAHTLEQQDILRKNMMADIAHELRTPLAILQGNLESLQEGVLEPTPQIIISLHDEVLRLSRLVQDLQDLSLAEAGNLPLSRCATSLPDLVENLLITLTGLIAEKNIEVTVAYPSPFPPVMIDPERITQVLFNLLSNAIRYTPAGGRIEITGKLLENFVEISVADTGPGLAEKDLPFVFDRFYRSDKGRDRRTGGTGLGLAITKGLVEAHGGQIRAQNRPGGGSCFSFTIPLTPPATSFSSLTK